jgi:hypothetical protein
MMTLIAFIKTISNTENNINIIQICLLFGHENIILKTKKLQHQLIIN